jgi:hypothetical protein
VQVGDSSCERFVHRAESFGRPSVAELLPQQRHEDPAEALALREPNPTGLDLFDQPAVLSVEDGRERGDARAT